jgi:hypothetical protein
VRRRFYCLRHVHLVACASPSSPSQDNTGVLQGTPNRACRYAQLFSHPLSGAALGVELDGPAETSPSERSPIPLGNPVTPDVPEHRRPVDPERCGQLLYRDTPTVGGNQLVHLVGCKTPLNRQRPNQRVGQMNRSLARALP